MEVALGVRLRRVRFGLGPRVRVRLRARRHALGSLLLCQLLGSLVGGTGRLVTNVLAVDSLDLRLAVCTDHQAVARARLVQQLANLLVPHRLLVGTHQPRVRVLLAESYPL